MDVSRAFEGVIFLRKTQLERGLAVDTNFESAVVTAFLRIDGMLPSSRQL
jgi:hypothetical protein